MTDALKELIKQPYWIIGLILGAALIAAPCVTIDKEFRFSTHSPSTYWLAVPGAALILFSALVFAYTTWSNHVLNKNAASGLDLSRVKQSKDALSVLVNNCEIRVVEGRLEDYVPGPGTAIVLPCNEYFDDKCVADSKSVLGAYVSRNFEGQVEEFIGLLKEECGKRFGPGSRQQKTGVEFSESFGPGKCLLLIRPLNRSSALALVSTTTQRANEGLSARISYLFEGMRALTLSLADARINEAVMPVLGAGHGGIEAPLALVGLILAAAEAARYGQGAQRLRRVTIVVFKRDKDSPAEVQQAIAQRALALVGTLN
jgi:hypothetical protein